MNKKGFTMVELLVVLLIVGILAAIATPLFLAHTKRAKASEAVAAMSQIRQALRDYAINHPGQYFNVAKGDIANGLPTSVNTTTHAPTPGTSGVEVTPGVTQYFSKGAYRVQVATDTTELNSPDAIDFLVTTDGTNGTDATANLPCGTASADCAIHATDVATYRLQMDNSGRIFISYDSGTNWSAW